MYRKGTKENVEFKKELRERIEKIKKKYKVGIIGGNWEGIRETIEQTVLSKKS